MLRKIGSVVAALVVVGGFAFGAMGLGTVSAAPPEDERLVCPGSPGDHGFGDHPWLRRSIVDSAAATIGVPTPVVVDGLQHGLSLNQIAYLNGVGRERLEAGILAREFHKIYRQVEAGNLTREQAQDLRQFLRAHIDEIVTRHFQCLATPDV